MKNVAYALFGEDFISAYNENGDVFDIDLEYGIGDFVKIDLSINSIEDILKMAVGWDDYTLITKQDYMTLLNLRKKNETKNTTETTV